MIGRADDITKVKGVLLAPSAIEEVVRGMEGLGDEYEDLQEAGKRIRAVERNVRRILGGIDMLERNICDLIEPEPWSP